MWDYNEVFVAFDIGKRKHAVAIAEGGRAGDVRFVAEIENSPATIAKMIKKLAGRYERLHVCYEAGPTGYGLYRQIRELGHDGMVIARPRSHSGPVSASRPTGATRLGLPGCIGLAS